MTNVNAFLPPGVTSSYRAEILDQQNVQSRLSNPNTIDKRIQLARMHDQQRKELSKQFEQIDIDGNGRITIDELSQFFMRLLIEEVRARPTTDYQTVQGLELLLKQEFIEPQQLDSLFNDDDLKQLDEREQSITEIFGGIDVDGNGTISKEEFIRSYVDTRQRLIEREEEVMREMVDHARQQDEVLMRLEEAERNEHEYINPVTKIRRDSKLKVHIVDAQNLRQGNYLVKVTQDNSVAETNVRTGAQPIWNEAIVFDITDPQKQIEIELIDSNGNVELRDELDLGEDPRLTDFALQGEEIWAYSVYLDEGREVGYEKHIERYQQYYQQVREQPHQYVDLEGMVGSEKHAKLRLRCHYSYSDTQRFHSLKIEWDDYIQQDIEELTTIRIYLQNLTSPFGFLKVIAEQAKGENGLKQEDMEDMKEQQEGDTKYHLQEKRYEEELDKVAKNIAKQMGYRHVPWLHATYFFLFVQLILSMLTQIHRKDQISITVCAAGIFMLSFPENTRRAMFRMLVLLIFVSLVQDVFWFVWNRDIDDDEDDGGLERTVKSFSRTMSFVSFFWRFVLAMILWKDSLDYVGIVKAKSVNKEELSLEDRVEQIMSEHPGQNNNF